MADTKISALTVATTPLAGTEVLPIVQSGVTKQVSVANLTAGRAVSADSLTLTGSPLAATSGGTGQSFYAVGDLLYASTTTALSKLADVATGNALISGGVGVAPSWGKIGLTTHVSGTLGAANGGTGQSSYTAGDLIYASGTTTVSKLAIGTANTVLTSSGSAPQWSNSLSLAGNLSANNISVTDSNWIGWGNYASRFTGTGGGSVNVVTNSVTAGTWDTSQNYTFYGNLIQGTAAKGINFTANTGAAGKTSQLLNWYEEGTWTPSDQSGAGLTFTTVDGYYTRIGRMVYASFWVTYPVTANASNNAIGGLPFTAANTNAARGGSALTYSEFGTVSSIYGPKNNTLFSVTDGVGNSRTNAVMSGKTIMGCIIYFT